MTPLRQRMLEDMQLRGFSARTQEAYVHAVRQVAAHFHKPPDQLTEASTSASHTISTCEIHPGTKTRSCDPSPTTW